MICLDAIFFLKNWSFLSRLSLELGVSNSIRYQVRVTGIFWSFFTTSFGSFGYFAINRRKLKKINFIYFLKYLKIKSSLDLRLIDYQGLLGQSQNESSNHNFQFHELYSMYSNCSINFVMKRVLFMNKNFILQEIK